MCSFLTIYCVSNFEKMYVGFHGMSGVTVWKKPLDLVKKNLRKPWISIHKIASHPLKFNIIGQSGKQLKCWIKEYEAD